MEKKYTRLPEHMSYLCIEGVIGAGKTTLCKLLAEKFNARPVLEYAEENPFLSSFYQDRDSHAFQTQLWFLLSRYRQLTETFIQQDLFHASTVSDYMFAKDRIFATVNLDENELALYNTIAALLERGDHGGESGRSPHPGRPFPIPPRKAADTHRRHHRIPR